MSVPNQWSALGVCRESDRLQTRGSTLVNSPGAIAMTTSVSSMSAEMTNSGLRRSSPQASPHRLEVAVSPPVWASWTSVLSLIADPGAEVGVDDVDDEVDDDEEQHEQRDRKSVV